MAKLFLLAGQSNADGHGLIAELPPQFLGPLAGVYIWTGSAFATLQAGVNNQAADATKCGPELSFGVTARAALGEDIYIVKHAVGGTPIAQWDNPLGDWNAESEGELLDQLIAKCAAARTVLDLRPSALLWMQGETDRTITAMAAAYKRNFKAFCAKLRDEIRVSRLPVLDATIPGPPGVDWFTVNELKRQASIEDFYVRALDSSGCEISADTIHFTAAGQVTLGELFAGAV